MKQKTLAIAISLAMLTGIASLDVIAGKGAGGSSGRSGGGMPGMGGMGGSSGMSGMGGGSGMSGMGGMSGGSGMSGMGSGSGMSGMGGGEYKGQGIDAQSRERHRIGEKEGVGERVREADQAR